MEYYIKERNWKQILEFIKGIHSKDEKRLRIFTEAVWTKWLPMAALVKDKT